MTSAAPPGDEKPPWTDPERRALPSERSARRQRTPRVLVVALAISIVLHFAALSGCVGLLLLVLPFPLTPPPPPERESIQVFVQPTPAPDATTPPETESISDRNTEANSPGDARPQAGGGAVPSDGGSPEPTLHPVTPEPEPELAPELAPEEPVEPRRRLADALRGMGGRSAEWGTLAAPGEGGAASSGLNYAFGDSSFQIESKADVDWGPWSRKVQALVRSNWYSVIPVAARVGMKGIVRVRFVVHRDGAMTDFELLDSSGILPLDQAVQTALVNLSNPLPPLPLRETDEPTIRLTYTFLYNLSDDREMRAWQRQRWLEQKRQQGGG